MRTLISGCGILSAALLLSLLANRTFAEDASSDLQGTWQVTATTINGKPIADRQIRSAKFTFTPQELFVTPGNKSQPERFKIEHEAGSSPPALYAERVEPDDQPQQGWKLFELKPGRLRLAFFDGLQERPQSFEPKPKLIVLELKRVVKD